jgi:twitching motility protein PilT
MSSAASNQQLAQIISRQNLLPVDIIDGLVTRARTLQEWLGQVAVDDHFLTHTEISSAISRDMGMPMVDLARLRPDLRALRKVPRETAHGLLTLPLKLEGNTLKVAMANPLDDGAKAALKSLVQVELSIQVAPADRIMGAVEDWYGQFSQEDLVGDAPGMATLFPGANMPGGAVASTLPQETTEVGLDELLAMMLEHRGSDLHMAVGSPPMMRVHGDLRSMPFPVMTPQTIQVMMYSILTDIQITDFENNWDLDFSYSIPGISRFRVNLHRQRNAVGAVLRTIPVDIPSLASLKMPAIVRELTNRPRGLCLVTGPTGSGKSTTLAAMIDEINSTKRAHIVTIEDPIEFLHKNKQSVVTQREVGTDTKGFSEALRRVLRQDPDVILIGEMRDPETIAAALTAAETGHLVFSTLHTTSAGQTIDRIIDVFPPHQQEQVRSMLSSVLEAIFTQTLLPRTDGKGRVCAQEILIATPAIRNLIREGKVHQMPSVLQASAKYGMQTLDNALRDLVARREVTLEEAILKSSNPDDFKALVAMQ